MNHYKSPIIRVKDNNNLLFVIYGGGGGTRQVLTIAFFSKENDKSMFIRKCFSYTKWGQCNLGQDYFVLVIKMDEGLFFPLNNSNKRACTRIVIDNRWHIDTIYYILILAMYVDC